MNIERGSHLDSEHESQENLSERDTLIKSGIAERILENIKKYRGLHDPEVIFGIDECHFKVELFPAEEDKEGKEKMQVVVEMPNLHPENSKEQPRVKQAFQVEKGESFGAASEPPLTDEQWRAVENIVEKKKEKEV